MTRRAHGGEEHSAERAAAAMASGESGKATEDAAPAGVSGGADWDESSENRMSAAARASEQNEKQPRDPIAARLSSSQIFTVFLKNKIAPERSGTLGGPPPMLGARRT